MSDNAQRAAGAGFAAGAGLGMGAAGPGEAGGPKSGRLLVVEGLDGSGKATQAKRLAAALASAGRRVRKISFPNYESESSALVRMYLSGEFGSHPGDVNAYAASTFFSVDRYAGYKADWGGFYAGGGILIADRYTTSNAVHQCAKLPRQEWDGFLDWLFHFEYTLLGIPAPDRVLYLRLDPAVGQQLLAARYAGDESKKDIHERDLAYLARSRAAAEYCAARFGWQVIECAESGALRPIEAIGRDVLTAAEPALPGR